MLVESVQMLLENAMFFFFYDLSIGRAVGQMACTVNFFKLLIWIVCDNNKNISNCQLKPYNVVDNDRKGKRTTSRSLQADVHFAIWVTGTQNCKKTKMQNIIQLLPLAW